MKSEPDKIILDRGQRRSERVKEESYERTEKVKENIFWKKKKKKRKRGCERL